MLILSMERLYLPLGTYTIPTLHANGGVSACRIVIASFEC